MFYFNGWLWLCWVDEISCGWLDVSFLHQKWLTGIGMWGRLVRENWQRLELGSTLLTLTGSKLQKIIQTFPPLRKTYQTRPASFRENYKYYGIVISTFLCRVTSQGGSLQLIKNTWEHMRLQTLTTEYNSRYSAVVFLWHYWQARKSIKIQQTYKLVLVFS